MATFSQMKLSIVINVFNGEEFIEDCLQAVFSIEDINKFAQVIIFDNLSTDRTLSIASDICRSNCHFQTIIHTSDQHLTLGDARRKAIEYCSGEWLVFCDVDDQLPKNLGNKLDELFGRADECNCNLILIDVVKTKSHNSTAQKTEFEKRNILNNRIFDLNRKLELSFLIDFFHVPVSSFFRRNKLSIDDDFSSYKQAEDFAMVCGMLARGNRVLIYPNLTSSYLLHHENLTKSQWELGFIESIKIIKKLPVDSQLKDRALIFWRLHYSLYHIYDILKNYSFLSVIYTFLLIVKVKRLNKFFRSW